MNLAFEQPFEQPTRAEVPGIQDPTDTMTLNSVSVPTRVRPNGNVVAEVDVRNTRCLRANVAHPDYCTFGGSSGWEVTVNGALGDSTDVKRRCQGCASSVTYVLELTAPSEAGSYTLDIEVSGRNTGALIGSDSQTITVESDAPEEPAPPDPDPGPELPSLPFLDGEETAIVALVVLLFLFIAVSLR